MLCPKPGGALLWRDGMPISALANQEGAQMNRIIYIIGLIVVIVFVLGFLGLR